MGNNSAFSNFEGVITACYKHGALTKSLLKDIAATFAGQDADSGGYEGIMVNGKDVYDIVIEVGGGLVPPKPNLPKDYMKWTSEQDQQNEEWHEARHKAFDAIADLE